MEKVLGDREQGTDWFVVGLNFFLMGAIGWGVTDLLFGHALLSICAGVITACLLGWPAYRSTMKNWGDKI